MRVLKLYAIVYIYCLSDTNDCGIFYKTLLERYYAVQICIGLEQNFIALLHHEYIYFFLNFAIIKQNLRIYFFKLRYNDF